MRPAAARAPGPPPPPRVLQKPADHDQIPPRVPVPARDAASKKPVDANPVRRSSLLQLLSAGLRRCGQLCSEAVGGTARRLASWWHPSRPVGNHLDQLEDHPDPLLDITPPPRFEFDDPAMLDHLKEHGYVVVSGVLSVSELKRAEDLLWEFLALQAGWSRRRPSTWTDESLGRIGQMFTGIVNGRGIGQSDLSWFVRTNARVRSVFARIWGTEELITSFDGINIFRPWHAGFLRTLGGWFHVDQGRTMPGFCCVQGQVSLFDQSPGTGGLVVIPGSHLRHQEVCAFAKNDADFIEPPAAECAAVSGAPHRLVSCRAGDLILWDSRCLHCNTPAVRAPERPPQQLLRAVVYVCMTPRAWATEEDLEKRRRGYEMRMTSSHWPHRNVMGFGWGKDPPLDYGKAPPQRQRLI